jgi:hypothetical protein
MGIALLLMVVDQIDVGRSIRLFAVSENQSPVSGHRQTPESLQVALERV